MNSSPLYEAYRQPTSNPLLHQLKKILFRFVFPLTIDVMQDVIHQQKPLIHALLDRLSNHLSQSINKKSDDATTMTS